MLLSLSPELERLITQQAQSLGYPTPEAYLKVVFGSSTGESTLQLSDEEFFRVLDDMSSEENLPTLPADFSRADIYADHD